MVTKQQVAEFLASGRRHVHFVGVGGVGMSGLARLLLELGHTVSGSDVAGNSLTEALRRAGATVYVGHDAVQVPSETGLVVYSTAVSANNPELVVARQRGVPCVPRGVLLAAVMNHRYNIAVAGTHGKTTTSSMIAHILAFNQMAPSFCIGAHVPVLGGNARLGSGRYFVAEACESDGTLVHQSPEFAVCLNIEAEHLDHYGGMEGLVAAFEALFVQARSVVFYCADCPRCVALAPKARQAVSFGLSDTAVYRAVGILPTDWGNRFTVACRGEKLCTVELVIPGLQNVVNALAAFAVADQLGVPVQKICNALKRFTGAQRRFERKYEGGGIVVVDDYAHHPTEIRATIAAARTLRPRRLVVAFQPHRYTRTRTLRDGFATAFRGADRLFLTDVYAASEEPIAGVSGRTIYDAVVAAGQRDVVYEPEVGRLTGLLVREARPGDLVLVMGAGSIGKVATAVAEDLARVRLNVVRDFAADLRALLSAGAVVRHNEPMWRHTSMRVGGPAEWFVVPADERDLAVLLRYCHGQGIPVTVVGRGTNLLVRDGGITGVVVHLDGPEFARIEVCGERIVARCGARLKLVVREACKHEVGGLEFLYGIPGSLGGALRMNAGAMGRELFEVVERVRYMSYCGEVGEVDARCLRVTYRGCPLFQNHIALSAVLRGRRSPRGQIEAVIREFEQRRAATQPSQPSAGCVFKNPPGMPAGRLIDELGLKGVRIGGARISEKHANFIVNDGRATASDVLRLMELVCERVRRERGIELEPEVMILGREP